MRAYRKRKAQRADDLDDTVRPAKDPEPSLVNTRRVKEGGAPVAPSRNSEIPLAAPTLEGPPPASESLKIEADWAHAANMEAANKVGAYRSRIVEAIVGKGIVTTEQPDSWRKVIMCGWCAAREAVPGRPMIPHPKSKGLGFWCAKCVPAPA